MKITFVSKILPQKMADILKKYANIRFLEPSRALSSELKYHPDIICSQFENTVYICEGCIPSGFNATAVGGIRDGYPDDCVLNNLITDKYIITGKRTALPYNDLCGRRIVRVNQGYVKCSVVDLGGRYVTSDISIYNKLRELGYDVLLTDNEGIRLDGFSCGFIGGATAVINKKLFVFGDITKHKDHDKITRFALSSVDGIISLGDGEIYDYGGAVTVEPVQTLQGA